MRKKERQRFVKNAKELLISLGAEQQGDGFILSTKAGKLTLHPTENTGKDGPGSVFTRFADPKAARRIVDCNPFSGKWNHHFFVNWSVETALADLELELKRILP